MGKLGFMFDIEGIEKRKIIFVETNKFNGDIILGIDEYFNKEDCEFYFLNKDLKLNKYILNEEFVKYSKIHASDKNILDFNDFIFWFNGKKYREIYRLLLIEDNKEIEQKLIKRVNNLIPQFIKN